MSSHGESQIFFEKSKKKGTIRHEGGYEHGMFYSDSNYY
jgi:hypothetical protein